MIMCGGSQIYVVEIVNHPAQFSMDEIKEIIQTVSKQDKTPHLQN